MNQPKMVAQQDDHNQTLALISKLLGPQQSSNILCVPPPIQPPPNLRTTNYLPFNPPPSTRPSYPLYPQAQTRSTLLNPPSVSPSDKRNPRTDAKDDKLSSYVSVVGNRKSSKYNDIDNPRKSRKRRHDERDGAHRNSSSSSKTSVFDNLMATHGNTSNNHPRDRKKSSNTESQKRMGKQIRDILTSSKPSKSSLKKKSDLNSSSGKKEKKRKHKKISRSDKNVDYGDLVELLPSHDNTVLASKRRKIQENVRSKRDSAAEKKEESIYDYMYYDADSIPALQKKRERILSALNKSNDGEVSREISPKNMDDIDATLKEIEREANNEVSGPPLPIKTSDKPDLPQVTPITPEKRVGIRGSLSRPPSPKPSASEIAQVLEDMEEGELSDDEEAYNQLINDVESVRIDKPSIVTETITIKGLDKLMTEISEVSPKSNIPPPINNKFRNSPLKTIPFFNINEDQVQKPSIEPSILDDLAFLNAIKTKYTADDKDKVPTNTKTVKVTKDKSKDLIEQLLRQDKHSPDREKQRRNKEKQREYERREKNREERKREKEERLAKEQQRLHDELFLNYRETSKTKTSHTKTRESVTKEVKSSDSRRLKQEFKNNFIKGSVTFEGTLMKSTIDNTVLSEEKRQKVGELVETNEHRFENGLVIQTSRSKVDEEELAAKNIPVKYNYKEVTEEYPASAVGGAIAYRLKEGKLKLIHRIVERIGKKTALEFLFETEEIEKNGGQMTAKGDRRRLPGGVYIGLLKKKLPKDDIKYIFTVENELGGTYEYQRKKQQAREKRKRYNHNKNERVLSNALNSALSLDKTDVPGLDTIALPTVSKPKTFMTSFVKKHDASKKETFVTLQKPNVDSSKRIENLKKGYGAFVKKGACDRSVFQPSKTSALSAESSTFDYLLSTHNTAKEERDVESVIPSVAEVSEQSGAFLKLTKIASNRTESILAKSEPITAQNTNHMISDQPITAQNTGQLTCRTEPMSEGELSEGELSDQME